MRAKNRTEAQRALGELASDLRRTGTRTTDRTLRETCEAWAEHAKPNLSPNTARELTGSLERYVYPSPLVARPLAKEKAVDLETLYRGLREHGGKVGGPLKPATVRKVHTALSLVFAPFPKSAGGKATIALDEGTVMALGSLRAWHDERAASFDPALVPEAYVFSPEIDGGRPLRPQVVTHRFGRLRRRLGTTGVRLHDLRRFAATQLLGAGNSVTAVAGRFGNSPAVLLGRYAHWVRVQDEDQATHMGKLVGMGVEAE